VKSKRHPRFRRAFAHLPQAVKLQARQAYRQFAANPFHPSLAFKRLNVPPPLWLVRINDNYRAVGVRAVDDEII